MTNFSFNGLKYLLFACVLFLFTSVNGQVVINEFSCSNYSLNIGGDNEDYIEFYNPGAVAEDIGGFFLSDNPLNLISLKSQLEHLSLLEATCLSCVLARENYSQISIWEGI